MRFAIFIVYSLLTKVLVFIYNRYPRRTFKDIITFIPVVIILLIPLSPVGHVLVFGAIQRFFPDFFPSCFTEQRQNLLKLYETAEYSKITVNENWKVRTDYESGLVVVCLFEEC